MDTLINGYKVKSTRKKSLSYRYKKSTTTVLIAIYCVDVVFDNEDDENDDVCFLLWRNSPEQVEGRMELGIFRQMFPIL